MDTNKTASNEGAQKKGRRPDFSSDSIAIWMNKDKDGKQHASVKVFGGSVIKCEAVPKEEAAVTASSPSSTISDAEEAKNRSEWNLRYEIEGDEK